jgi:hypothetical protein
LGARGRVLILGSEVLTPHYKLNWSLLQRQGVVVGPSISLLGSIVGSIVRIFLFQLQIRELFSAPEVVDV